MFVEVLSENHDNLCFGGSFSGYEGLRENVKRDFFQLRMNKKTLKKKLNFFFSLFSGFLKNMKLKKPQNKIFEK